MNHISVNYSFANFLSFFDTFYVIISKYSKFTKKRKEYMKKLLLLLFFIPTLIQAEEFKLVCEGERVLTKSDSDVFRIKKSIVVKVRKASIRAEDETYYLSLIHI